MPLCLSLLLPIIPFASLHHVFALSFFHLSLPYLHCLATFFPPAPPHFLYHSVSLPLHHFLTLAPLSLIFLCQMSFYLSQSLSVRKPCSVHIGRKARQTPNGLKMEPGNGGSYFTALCRTHYTLNYCTRLVLPRKTSRNCSTRAACEVMTVSDPTSSTLGKTGSLRVCCNYVPLHQLLNNNAYQPPYGPDKVRRRQKLTSFCASIQLIKHRETFHKHEDANKAALSTRSPLSLVGTRS